MRISTAQIFGKGVDAMQRSQAELVRTQEQLSTGKKLLAASDDPAGAVQALKLRERIGSVDQFARNAGMGLSRLNQEESVLNELSGALQRVRELTVQAGNATLTDDDRATIAREVRHIGDSILASTNTRDANGEYLFAGYKTSTVPFVRTPDGSVEYRGDLGERRIPLSPDRSVVVGRSGQEFMSLPRSDGTGEISIFGALDELVEAMTSPAADETERAARSEAIGNGLGHIDAALDRVLELRTDIGGRVNTIESHGIVNEAQKVELERALSAVEDLDYAEAISRFSIKQVALQAAQQTYMQLSRLSLFDYLR